MPELRTNYLVICKNHPSSGACSFCKRCKDLGMELLRYGDKQGFHFNAQKSVSFRNAKNTLRIHLGTPEFDLLSIRGRINKKKMSVIKKDSRRRASVVQASEEEGIQGTKRLKTSSSNGVKVEPSTKVLQDQVSRLSRQVTELQRGHDNIQRVQVSLQRRQDRTDHLLDQFESDIKGIIDIQRSTSKLQRDTAKSCKFLAASMATMRTEIRDENDDLIEKFRRMIQSNHERTQNSLQSLGSTIPSHSNETRPVPNAPITKRNAGPYDGPALKRLTNPQFNNN